MIRLFFYAPLLLLTCTCAAAAPPEANLVEVKKIWDEAPHSAFTDLAYWKNQFVCVFREGRGHVSADGRIRVLTSPDGAEWSSAAVVELEGFDLRDAGLSVLPDGKLMLVGGAAPRKTDNESAPTATFVAFSQDAATWTRPKIVVPPGRWMWRVAWSPAKPHKAYGVSYAAPDGRPFSSLLTSSDGVDFQPHVARLYGEGYPTEAALRFDSAGMLYCLQRRDGDAPENSALLGISAPPYIEWQWHDLKIYFGGPNFIQLPSGVWIAAGRILREDGPKTELAVLNMEEKSLEPIQQLPSGGDTSYPGLVWHDDTLWVSYYSSHEDKTSIYLAKVRLH